MQKPAFAPVALAPPASATTSAHGAEPAAPLPRTNGMIEVVLTNGRILRIGADIDLAALKRIAAALEDEA